MPKYKYVADWEDTHQEGEIDWVYPEVDALFKNFGLDPSEVSVVTREGIRITWTRAEDPVYSCPFDECEFESPNKEMFEHIKTHYPSDS